jgi:RNA polymerase sigma-70 factor (ECF subfamily)
MIESGTHFPVNDPGGADLYKGRDLRLHAAEPIRREGTATVSQMSFENLVHEYGPQVLRTATRVLHDASLAHDVHQEVFLSIWQRWHRYNGDVNWPAYLYRATVRKALEAARHRPVCSVPARASSEETPPGVITNGPEDAFQAEELQRKLVAALARLSRRQADAFILARLEGLEAAEIGEIMGCSEQTVRVHLHRAVLRLARELHEYLSQE